MIIKQFPVVLLVFTLFCFTTISSKPTERSTTTVKPHHHHHHHHHHQRNHQGHIHHHRHDLFHQHHHETVHHQRLPSTTPRIIQSNIRPSVGNKKTTVRPSKTTLEPDADSILGEGIASQNCGDYEGRGHDGGCYAIGDF